MLAQPPKPAAGPSPQRVFISGASSGIGQALACQYAAQGAVLGLLGRNQARLQQLADSLDGDHAIYAVDVRDHEALAAAAQAFMQQHGTPDIVIANAGVSRGTLTELASDQAAFQAVMEINVLGMLHTFQPFIAAMRTRGQGQLVGIASVAGIRGLPGAAAYSASKAAAIAYLESLRSEMQHHGIHVSTIVPGYIRTPMTAVNDYPMPFLMDVDDAAVRFMRAIARHRRYSVIPWQMGIISRLMRLIPAALWDRLTRNAPRKPRT